MNFTILRFETLDSTNTEAINQAKQGAEEGLCVVARRQTAGRGRHGRTWISEKDAGLYFSIVLRPKIENKFLPLLTLMSAVAVYETLKNQFQLKPDIKWANDVHINEKKISGILAEMIETKKGTAIVVGIGINLKSSNFLPEIAAIATSIEAETNETVDFDELVSKLTSNLAKYYKILSGVGGAEKIRQEWSEKSSYFRNKPVRVVLDEQTIIGVTDGIEKNGALRVKIDSGEVEIIQAGDVSSLRKAD